jgi:hypothetical protein
MTMSPTLPLRLLAAGVVFVAATACNPSSGSEQSAAAEAPAEAATVAAATVDATLPTVLVYKTSTCGCCEGWVEHLRAAGFKVDARDVTDLMSVKTDAGVPTSMTSCHTGIVDGYVVEGHVPAEQLKRLLAERPDIAGIAVPGMRIGSPGMEGPGATPYEVLSFDGDGNTEVFAEIDPNSR